MLHAEYSNLPLKFFKDLKTKRENKRPKSIEYLFKTQSQKLDHGLQASYEIALLIAKKAKPHNIGEELIKPALSIFAHTVLQQSSDAAVENIALSNDPVRRKIDELFRT